MYLGLPLESLALEEGPGFTCCHKRSVDESFGKKMGISAAVGGDGPTDFSGLFKDTGQELESNMDNVKIKQKAGGGIAANLAKLKKLKGGD